MGAKVDNLNAPILALTFKEIANVHIVNPS